MKEESAQEFFARNEPVFTKWDKYKKMSATEYYAQLVGLIESAGSYLPEKESDKVLLDAFNLIRIRLGIRIESTFTFQGAVI